MSTTPPPSGDEAAAYRAGCYALAGKLDDARRAIHDAERFGYFVKAKKPIIAAINGPIAGIGLVMALYADIRFAAANAGLAVQSSQSSSDIVASSMFETAPGPYLACKPGAAPFRLPGTSAGRELNWETAAARLHPAREPPPSDRAAPGGSLRARSEFKGP